MFLYSELEFEIRTVLFVWIRNKLRARIQSLPNRSERVVQCQIIDQKDVPRVRLISFLPKNAKNLRRLRSDGKLPINEWFFLITVNYLKLGTKQRMYPHRLYDDQGRFLVENRTRLMHSGCRFSKFVYVDIVTKTNIKSMEKYLGRISFRQKWWNYQYTLNCMNYL